MTSDPALISIPLVSDDSRPVTGTSLADLDLPAVERHIAQAVERGRYRGPRTPLEYLHERGCIWDYNGSLLATTAGLLCFGHTPQRFFQKAVVDFSHHRTSRAISSEGLINLEKDIDGTLFQQIDRVDTYLWDSMRHGRIVLPNSVQAVDIHEYPRVVIRELLVNALAHRDYANIHSATRVAMFRDRCEFINPGGLPPGMTMHNLITAQASRNPRIHRILYEAAYVEAIGQGLDTVHTVLALEGMAPPRFDEVDNFFAVVIRARRWDEQVVQGDVRLTPRQQAIMGIIDRQREATLSIILAQLPNAPHERTVQRDLKRLVDTGYLFTEGERAATKYRMADTVPLQKRLPLE